MVLENEIMYGTTFDVSDEVMDPNFSIPLGKAKIEREGELTLVREQSLNYIICSSISVFGMLTLYIHDTSVISYYPDSSTSRYGIPLLTNTTPQAPISHLCPTQSVSTLLSKLRKNWPEKEWNVR